VILRLRVRSLRLRLILSVLKTTKANNASRPTSTERSAAQDVMLSVCHALMSVDRDISA
jgi:hypothetical protein